MFHLSGGAQEHNSKDLIVDFSSASNQFIKNVRFCCRTLNATASRYLIARIRVELTSKSLSHLEKVSNHPLIRHGVRAIQICLAQYDDRFENNLEEFIRYHKDEIDRPYAWHPETDFSRVEFVSLTWGKYLETIAAQDHNLPGRFDRKEVDCIQALLEGYRLYQCGLQEQKSLQVGGFVARVSASMAELPAVKHLELTDWDEARLGLQPRSNWSLRGCQLDLSSNESIVRSLACFRNPFSAIQGNTLLHMVPNLICANITSLNIRISPSVHGCTELSLLNLQENQLRSNLTELRSFRFENYGWVAPITQVDQPGFRPLAHFLHACLGSESLEHLFIYGEVRGSSPNRSLLSPRSWPRLKSAVLHELPVSEADLDVLTRSIASQPEGSLTLSGVHLYGEGTWAGVLDMLRARRIRVSLDYQCGAEFETNPTMATEIFVGNTGFVIHDTIPTSAGPVFLTRETLLPSFAEYYVRGEDMPNPFVDPPSQEVRDRLLGLVPNSVGPEV